LQAICAQSGALQARFSRKYTPFACFFPRIRPLTRPHEHYFHFGMAFRYFPDISRYFIICNYWTFTKTLKFGFKSYAFSQDLRILGDFCNVVIISVLVSMFPNRQNTTVL